MQIEKDMKKDFPMSGSKAEHATGAGRRSVLSRYIWSTASVLSMMLPLAAASEASAQSTDKDDSPYLAPKQMTQSPTGVDLQSGKFSHSVTDLSVGPLTLERTYLGGQGRHGHKYFGPNWTLNHSSFVYQKDLINKIFDTMVVINGKEIPFNRVSETEIQWASPDSEGAFLEGSTRPGEHQWLVYTDPQGDVYTFNKEVKALGEGELNANWPNQRIARIDYANGHQVTYTYTGTDLTRIASNFGYSIVLTWSNGYISKACGYNAAEPGKSVCTTYAYGSPNSRNVSEVTDAASQKWRYDYASDGQLTCVRKVNATTPDCIIRNEYNGAKSRHVSRQIAADGGVWNYTFGEADREYDLYMSHGVRETVTSGYTDPEGNWVSADFYSGQLKKYYQSGNTNAPGWNLSQTRTTELDWDGLELVKLTHPEGNSVSYARRAGVVVSETWTPKPGSGLLPVSTSSGFPTREGPYANYNYCAPSVGRKRCNKPIWKKDFNGNQTDYTYFDHGGVATETGPAVNPETGPSTSKVRPQKRYTYVALTGSAAPAGPPIWLVRTMSFCRTTNFENGACRKDGVVKAGDEVVTTYDYEPKNLNLKTETVTADGVSRRVCYSYDWRGNKISATGRMGTCS
jgi:hypothetical protein